MTRSNSSPILQDYTSKSVELIRGHSNLTMSHLAVGMILFTAVMCFDISAFGWKMRKQWKAAAPNRQKASKGEGLFAWQGWSVLAAIWLLISGGWWLVL